jgi:hypothetical protein
VPYHPEGLGPLLCIGRSPISGHAIFSVGFLKRDPRQAPRLRQPPGGRAAGNRSDAGREKDPLEIPF